MASGVYSVPMYYLTVTAGDGYSLLGLLGKTVKKQGNQLGRGVGVKINVIKVGEDKGRGDWRPGDLKKF